MRRVSTLVTLAFVFMMGWSSAYAANRVGNGGVVVECPDSPLQLLDFYEAGGRTYPVGLSGTDPIEMATQRLKILERVAPQLASQYLRRLKSMPAEWDLKDGVSLTETKDALNAQVPDACVVKQVVIRMDVPTLEADKRFTVDKKRWEQMVPVQRAGLYLHEIVYEHLHKLGEKDSRKARRLVGLLFSHKLEAMTQGKFWIFVKDLEIPVYP